MTLGALHFAEPLWLVAGVLIAASLIVLMLRLERQRRKALASFSSRSMQVSSLSRGLRHFKASLTVLGVALICCALARPQYGFREEETYRRGLDLMFVIDTSKSMLAPDLKPNRLTRAKLALYDLVSKFAGDRVGLVAFAGDAFLQCPLTLDRNMFVQSLDAIDTDIIPRGGTDLGRALRVAVDALHNQPANRKLLVLLTDGEDLESGALAAAREASSAGVRIYTVGVGTPSGELIPLPSGGFVKDESGAFVHSRLDEKTLTEIASITGGQYRPLGADGRGLELLYQDVLAKLPQDTVGERMHRVPLERFEWPLGLGALCLALDALLQERRRRRAIVTSGAGHARPFKLKGRAVMAGIGVIAIWGLSGRAHASVTQAEKDYREGKFKQSAGEYRNALDKHPEDARLRLDLGAATYKSGDYAAAGAALQQALQTGGLDLQQRAYYDLGNSLYRTGERSVQAEPDQTMARWKEAITSYDGALKLNPNDADALYNRDLVKRKLAQLEKQQQQQPKPNQDNKQQQSGQQKQAKNGAGKQNDQQQSGQGKQSQPQSGQAKNDASAGQKQSEEHGEQQARAQQGGSQAGTPKPAPGQGPGQPPGQSPERSQAQGQAPQPEQPNASPGSGQEQKPTAGQAGLAKGVTGADQQEETPETPPKPGQLSRADARALLDSLRGDERLMSASGVENVKKVDDEPIKKDW